MQFRQTQLFLVGILFLSLGSGGCTPQAAQTDSSRGSAVAQETQAPVDPPLQPQDRKGDVPYVPTPDVVVDAMLKLAQVRKGDVLYDLGSGDGRIVITAAQKYGVKGTGIDINPELVQTSRENASKAGVSHLTRFLQEDIFRADFSEATVVTLYLLPDVNLKLRPRLLKELKPGTRIVSHDFSMGDWKPKQVITANGPNRTHTLYYWVVPEKVPPELLSNLSTAN